MSPILKLIKFLRFVFFFFIFIVALTSIGTTFLIFLTTKDLPKIPAPLSQIIETPQTQIYDSNGQMVASLGERKTIPLNMVSKNFINAILAVEDHRFFKHHGVNKLRLLKGLYITLFKSGQIQGGSTITQQLAKNLFFSFEKTYERKFKEMLAALQIESSNTKEEILHAYINQIHFGSGAQGIEKAAKTFFKKNALDLNLSEAAILAGLPKSPTKYNPFRNYELALQRRDLVLRQMVKTGFISDIEAQNAMLIKPKLNKQRSDFRTGDYFVDAIINDLISKYGEDIVYHGGIKVFATIDNRMQLFAKQSLQKGLERLDKILGIDDKKQNRPQGALISIDNGTGAIKALIGGRDYYTSEFNRAIKSKRQSGSGFKPFLYYSAFKDLKFHPGIVVTDKPVTIPVIGSLNWEPKNFKKDFLGDMVLKKAMTHSVNTIAAQLVKKIGPESIIKTAKACGIQSQLENVYSIALGTSNITPFEMAASYSVFANLGVKHEPFLFWRIEDAFGRVVFEHIVQKKRVLEPAITYQVLDMMKAVVDTGSARSIRRNGFNRPAAGKTGTTNNYNDAWFTGFTPTLTTSIWTGFDKRQKLITSKGLGITGGMSAAPIWADFMSNALNNKPERDFPIPDDIRFVQVDYITGCISEKTKTTIKIALKSDQTPCKEKGKQ